MFGLRLSPFVRLLLPSKAVKTGFRLTGSSEPTENADGSTPPAVSDFFAIHFV